MSTTGIHNHPPHVKNSTSAKLDVPCEPNTNIQQQAYTQPMSNQIQNMPSASVTTGMINQMNFGSGGGGSGTNNNNFSMTNILNTQMSDMDPSSILSQTSSGSLNQLDSNIQITPIINASIDNLQMQQHQRNVMHVDTTITSANNWFFSPILYLSLSISLTHSILLLAFAMNDNFDVKTKSFKMIQGGKLYD